LRFINLTISPPPNPPSYFSHMFPYGLQWFIIIYVNLNLAFALLCITSDNQLIHWWKNECIFWKLSSIWMTLNAFWIKLIESNSNSSKLNRQLNKTPLNWIKIQLKKKWAANWWRKYWKYVCEYDLGKKTFKKTQIQKYIFGCLFIQEWAINLQVWNCPSNGT